MSLTCFHLATDKQPQFEGAQANRKNLFLSSRLNFVSFQMKNKSNVTRPKLMMNLPNATGRAPIKLPSSPLQFGPKEAAEESE
jgi:hypothetical protein